MSTPMASGEDPLSEDELASRGTLTPELATTLRGAVGLRNRIAHGYAMLDYHRVHEEARAGLGSLRTLLAAVADAVGLE